MQKTSLVILLLLITTTTFGQSKLPMDTTTNHVMFRTIIDLDTTYKANKIYSLIKDWFSTNVKEFNRSNSGKNLNILQPQSVNPAQVDELYQNDQPLKVQDLDNKKLIGKGVLKYTGGLGCISVIYLEFDIKVAIKDYKLKIDITNFNYTHYNKMSMKQSPISGWDDDKFCNSKNTIENLLNCEQCKGNFEKFYSYLTTDMKKIADDLKTYLNSENEKW